MTFQEKLLKRPVLIYCVAALFIILGVVGLEFIPIQARPSIDYPLLTINTTYPGANAKLIDQVITKPLENNFNTISGINSINSYSESNKSSITISFNYGANMQSAYNQVVARIEAIKQNLPSNAHYPEIVKVKTGEEPIMLLALTGKQSLARLNNYAQRNIVTQLENITGVGKIDILGDEKQSVDIVLNPAEMAAYGITLNNVQSAFRREHIAVPGGVIESGKSRHVLNLDFEHHQISDLESLILGYRAGTPIFLKNIAKINYSQKSDYSEAFYNGKPVIGLSIIKQSGTNTLATINGVEKRVAEISAKSLPVGMNLSTVYSQKQDIWETVSQLLQDLFISFIAAGLVILFFLLSFRPMIIVMIAIPVVILFVEFCLFMMKGTLNSITLLGMVVVVGIVVDDAIVVVENIFSQLKDKSVDIFQAAIKSISEIKFSIIACSFTLLCIFIPTMFISGSIGLMTKPLGQVVNIGIFSSLLLALTLVPLLSSKLLKYDDKQLSGLPAKIGHFHQALQNFYKRVLNLVQNKPWLFIVIMIVLLVAAWPVYTALHKTYIPVNSNTGYFNIKIDTPIALNVEYTKSRVLAAENVLKQKQFAENIKDFFVSSGPTPNKGNIYVVLKSNMSTSQKTLMTNMQNALNEVPGAQYFVQLPSNNNTVDFEIRGPSYAELYSVAGAVSNKLQRYPELGPVYLIYTPNEPDYQLKIDRVMANSLGISVHDIADSLMATGSRGLKIGKFTNEQNDQYDVLLKIQKDQLQSGAELGNFYLETQNQKFVSLKSLVKIEEGLVPSKITRSALTYSLSFSTKPTVSTNDAVSIITKEVNSILPRGYSFGLLGQAQQLADIESQLLLIIGLVFLFMYVVLASLFNSFAQPIIIMLAQPVAIVGGLLTLLIFNETLNMYSMIGLLLLIGLVSKNSILIISFSNKLVEQGKSMTEALNMVCPERLRPILMTSCTIIITMLPPAIIGNAMYRSLALVIIGGMIVSTILSLAIVPASCLILDKMDFDHSIKRKKQLENQLLITERRNK